MIGRQVFRFEVPVDDEWHCIGPIGPMLHVGCRRAEAVEFWAESTGTESAYYRVFGTGREIPSIAEYVGTAIAPGGHLVWHLFRDAS